MNRSSPPGPIVPSVFYDDVIKAVDWLCDAFGFVEHLRWGPEGGETVQLGVGEGSIFVRGSGSSPAPGERLRALTHALMVDVTDVDRHYEQAKRAGAEILLEPETHVFGERQYTARDLAGHHWTFTQSVSDVAPEDWGARRPAS